MNNIKILLLSLFMMAFAAACTKEKSAFQGGDNFIASFQLTKDGVVLKGVISPGKISIVVPENLSLTGADVLVVLSENSTISPAPESISDWNESHTFTITSRNGTKAIYEYSISKSAVSKEGDVVLLTQADVEALAQLNITELNGSLTIGAATGKDSVYSLQSLRGLKVIQYGLTINSTYAGGDLKGLEDLERIGGLHIISNKALSLVELPNLKSVMSDLIVNQSLVEKLNFPELVNIDKGLQVLSTDSLAEMNLPKLKIVVENLLIQGGWSVNKLVNINLPLLEKVGGNVNVTNWKEITALVLPKLTGAASLSITSLPKLVNLNLSKFTSVIGSATISNNSLMTTMDLMELSKVGGDLRIENNNELENLDGIKNVTAIVGELFISNLSKLKSIQGFKALTSVGKRVYMSGLLNLEDNSLSGMSNLAHVGGDVVISQVRFQKFSGFSLTSIPNLSIFGHGLSSIQEVDVSNIEITNTLTISNITSPFILKGKNIYNGRIAVDNSEIASMEGLNEVKSFSYSSSFASLAPRSLGIKKITDDLSVTVYGFEHFKLPLLTEVQGKLTLTTADGIKKVEMPLLEKTGEAVLDVAILPAFSLPELGVVNGPLKITSGKYNGDMLAELQLPKLTTVNGLLSVIGLSSSYGNSKLKNLSGFSALRSVQGVNIVYNAALKDFTGLKGALSSFGAANWKVTNNGYNPSYQNMLNEEYAN